MSSSPFGEKFNKQIASRLPPDGILPAAMSYRFYCISQAASREYRKVAAIPGCGGECSPRGTGSGAAAQDGRRRRQEPGSLRRSRASRRRDAVFWTGSILTQSSHLSAWLPGGSGQSRPPPPVAAPKHKQTPARAPGSRTVRRRRPSGPSGRRTLFAQGSPAEDGDCWDSVVGHLTPYEGSQVNGELLEDGYYTRNSPR